MSLGEYQSASLRPKMSLVMSSGLFRRACQLADATGDERVRCTTAPQIPADPLK
jgi:hypothetical protein